MKLTFLSLFCLLASCEPVWAFDYDDKFDAFFAPIADLLEGFILYKINVLGAELPLVVIWLATARYSFHFTSGSSI